VRQLQRFQRYPLEAQSRNEQGVVLLGFTLDRDGHVLAHSIARSSGYTDLDNEVMAMIMRAQPLPPFPASMSQPRIDLTVPIRFSLR
jgi:periplasmic protein TonB